MTFAHLMETEVLNDVGDSLSKTFAAEPETDIGFALELY
jgi:hypothetical protein